MRAISRCLKDDVLSLLLQGYSTREIANRVGISHSSVVRIHQQTSRELPELPAGRPKRLSLNEEHRILCEVESGHCKNATDVIKALYHDTPNPPSASTIRRVWHAAGLEWLRRRKKPLLTKQHICERLAFARQYAGWTTKDWKCVIWSDEMKINLRGPDGDAYYWGRQGEELSAWSVRQVEPHGGGHIMMWGCMTARGLGFMCRIEGNMDAQLYVQILSDELLRSLKYIRKLTRAGQDLVFIYQDCLYS